MDINRQSPSLFIELLRKSSVSLKYTFVMLPLKCTHQLPEPRQAPPAFSIYIIDSCISAGVPHVEEHVSYNTANVYRFSSTLVSCYMRRRLKKSGRAWKVNDNGCPLSDSLNTD